MLYFLKYDQWKKWMVSGKKKLCKYELRDVVVHMETSFGVKKIHIGLQV